MPDQRFERYRRKEDWIQRYIFPGSLLPSLEALQTAMSRASSLIVVGLEEIGPHYADTLKAWRERFLAQPARGARARLRRPLHPDLGLLPRLLRGAVQDARDPRHAARPRPTVRGARMTRINTVRERTSIPSQLAGIVALVVPALGLVAARLAAVGPRSTPGRPRAARRVLRGLRAGDYRRLPPALHAQELRDERAAPCLVRDPRKHGHAGSAHPVGHRPPQAPTRSPTGPATRTHRTPGTATRSPSTRSDSGTRTSAGSSPRKASSAGSSTDAISTMTGSCGRSIVSTWSGLR